MASTIISGAGKLFGIGKKKKTTEPAAAATPKKGPVVSPLTDANAPASLRRRLTTAQAAKPRTLGGASDLNVRLGG